MDYEWTMSWVRQFSTLHDKAQQFLRVEQKLYVRRVGLYTNPDDGVLDRIIQCNATEIKLRQMYYSNQAAMADCLTSVITILTRLTEVNLSIRHDITAAQGTELKTVISTVLPLAIKFREAWDVYNKALEISNERLEAEVRCVKKNEITGSDIKHIKRLLKRELQARKKAIYKLAYGSEIRKKLAHFKYKGIPTTWFLRIMTLPSIGIGGMNITESLLNEYGKLPLTADHAYEHMVGIIGIFLALQGIIMMGAHIVGWEKEKYEFCIRKLEGKL